IRRSSSATWRRSSVRTSPKKRRRSEGRVASPPRIRLADRLRLPSIETLATRGACGGWARAAVARRTRSTRGAAFATTLKDAHGGGPRPDVRQPPAHPADGLRHLAPTARTVATAGCRLLDTPMPAHPRAPAKSSRGERLSTALLARGFYVGRYSASITSSSSPSSPLPPPPPPEPEGGVGPAAR